MELFARANQDFRWTLTNEPWNKDPNAIMMRLLSVEVTFAAQGRDYSVRLSTLVDTTPPTDQTSTSNGAMRRISINPKPLGAQDFGAPGRGLTGRDGTCEGVVPGPSLADSLQPRLSHERLSASKR